MGTKAEAKFVNMGFNEAGQPTYALDADGRVWEYSDWDVEFQYFWRVVHMVGEIAPHGD